MPFEPKFSITTKMNKVLVEIERVRGFLDAVDVQSEWIRAARAPAIVPKERLQET